MKLIKIVKKMTYIGHEFHMLVISLQSADLEWKENKAMTHFDAIKNNIELNLNDNDIKVKLNASQKFKRREDTEKIFGVFMRRKVKEVTKREKIETG